MISPVGPDREGG